MLKVNIVHSVVSLILVSTVISTDFISLCFYCGKTLHIFSMNFPLSRHHKWFESIYSYHSDHPFFFLQAETSFLSFFFLFIIRLPLHPSINPSESPYPSINPLLRLFTSLCSSSLHPSSLTITLFPVISSLPFHFCLFHHIPSIFHSCFQFGSAVACRLVVIPGAKSDTPPESWSSSASRSVCV